MDGQKEARKSEPADAQMEKGEEIWTFETMPSTNFFFLIVKNKLVKIGK